MKNVAEIIIKKDVNKILDLFCACFDIRILFYSDKGDGGKVKEKGWKGKGKERRRKKGTEKHWREGTLYECMVYCE